MMPVAMVGRAAELAEIGAAWADVVAAGTSRTAMVTSAAGLGKSLLVTRAVESVRPRPPVVLTGRARVHSPAPYDWLAGVLSGRETSDLPVPADALAWLAQHPDAPRERYTPGALLRLAVRTVRALVGTGPAILVVEDLHALDPASLNLVGELALAGLPALLLVTSRPAEESVAPELTARTVARLAGTPGAVRQHLDPLDVTQVGQVLAQVYPDRPVPVDVASAVCERTGGNPYWLTELLATGGRSGPEALAQAPLPEHLHAAARGATGPASATVAPAAELTAREVEVLTCLAAGMSNKQVARSLSISVRTVTVHVSNLLRKTRSASRTEAALWAVRHLRLPQR
jgi:DNA-binding CsgD family transcriptional regulator